jgi:NDP-sugar pyrophosphorylase family protein
MEVARKPFVEHQLELLRRNGYSRVVLCLGYLGQLVQAKLTQQRNLGMDLGFVFDGERLLGTGGALRNALPFLGEQFFVLYGDSYLDCDYPAVERAFVSSGKHGLMTVFANKNQWQRSNVLFRDGRIARYDKHQPAHDMNHIDYGLGALTAHALEKYPSNTFLDLATVYQDLIASEELAGYEVSQRFYEIGSLEGLAETGGYLLTKDK